MQFRRSTSPHCLDHSILDIFAVKQIIWLGDSLERLREFEPDAKRIAGYQLERVQAGRKPSDFKPMPPIGLGANEIRIRTRESYRVLYVAKYPEAVYVLHAFVEKSTKAPKVDLEIGRQRFKTLVQGRKLSHER